MDRNFTPEEEVFRERRIYGSGRVFVAMSGETDVPTRPEG
jgi:hypothetical protein